ERPADEAADAHAGNHLGRELQRLAHRRTPILRLRGRRIMTRAGVTHLVLQILQAPFNGLGLAVALTATGLLNGSRHIAARSLGNGFWGRPAQACAAP